MRYITVNMVLAHVGDIQAEQSPGANDNIGLMGGVMYGDPVFYAGATKQGSIHTPDFRVYRCHLDGQNTIFRMTPSPGGSGIFTFDPSGAFQLSDNAVQVGIGGGLGIMQAILPNIFANGQIVFVPNGVTNPPLPCGGNLSFQTYYDSDRGLISFTSGKTTGFFTNINAAIYSLGIGGLSLLGSGSIGNFPNGFNGYDRTNATLPPFVTAANNPRDLQSLTYRGGAYAFNNVGAVGGSNRVFGAARTQIKFTNNLQCGNTQSNADNYVYTDQAYTYHVTDIEAAAPPTWLTFVDRQALGGSFSQIPGIYLYSAVKFNGQNYNNLFMFTQDYVAQIICNIQLNSVVLLNDGHVIGISRSRLGQPQQIWVGLLDLVGLGLLPSPNPQPPVVHYLINHCRPVSVDGSFVT